MTITSIRSFPTTITAIPVGCRGVHESTLKAYQILGKVKELLHKKVPSEVVLELIEEMEEKGES